MAFKFCAGNPHHHLQAHSVYTFTELYNDSIPSIPILMTQTQHIENLLDELLQNILDEEDIIALCDKIYKHYTALEKRFTRQRKATFDASLLQLGTELREFTDYPFTLEDLEVAHEVIGTEYSTQVHNRDTDYRTYYSSD